MDVDTEDPEVATAITLRRPDAPTTINELALLKGEAQEIIEARATIIATLRLASIKATSPEDWLLFKTPDDQGGQVVGYLQDCGCDRVRDLWGIEVFDIGRPEKINGSEPGVFHYLITGSGRCKITKQTVEMMEGGRSSTDDFCKEKTGADLELAVRKAARANLDGNIGRELSGLKSVPLAEIERAWEGTAKKTDRCRLGRGFGSRRERLGEAKAGEPEVEPPKCEYCGTPGRYFPENDKGPAVYLCPNHTKKHPDKRWRVNAKEWERSQQSKQPAPATNGPLPTVPPNREIREGDKAPKPKPVTANDIPFASSRERQPGEDG